MYAILGYFRPNAQGVWLGYALVINVGSGRCSGLIAKNSYLAGTLSAKLVQSKLLVWLVKQGGPGPALIILIK